MPMPAMLLRWLCSATATATAASCRRQRCRGRLCRRHCHRNGLLGSRGKGLYRTAACFIIVLIILFHRSRTPLLFPSADKPRPAIIKVCFPFLISNDAFIPPLTLSPPPLLFPSAAETPLRYHKVCYPFLISNDIFITPLTLSPRRLLIPSADETPPRDH